MIYERRKRLIIVALAMLFFALLIPASSCKKNKSFTVTFDSNGGSKVEAQEVLYKECAVIPKEPTKDGYIFIGWFKGDSLYDFSTPVKKDITLVAYWKEFNNDTESISESDKQSESEFSAESDSQAQSEKSSESISSSDKDSGETSESIKFFTVTFDSNGGDEVKSQTIQDGNLINVPQTPTKDGYDFVGWFLNDTEFDFSTPITCDIKLIARWQISSILQSFSVVFVTGCEYEVSPQTVLLNGFVEKPANPQRVGYNFLGWYHNEEEYDFSLPVTQNLTLVAKWEEVETQITYTVSFITDSETVIDSQTINKGECAKLPTQPQKDGYIFVGWYLNGEPFDFNTLINGNIELIAKWQEEKYFTVSFVVSGAEGIPSQTVKVGNFASEPPTPIKDGYVFIAWLNNGETYLFDSPVTCDLTLTAKWEEVKPLDDLLGAWVGIEDVEGVKIEYNLVISNADNLTLNLTINDLYANELNVQDVCYYGNCLAITFIKAGVDYKLSFIVQEGTLVCQNGVYGGQIVLEKKST